MRSGQHVREAFLTRVTRRNRNPLLRRRFGLAHWLPVPVTRFGANWRPRLISKLQNIFTLLWFSTPPPPPLHSFALSLPPFFALPLCFLVTASSYRCYPLCTFFFSLFFFFLCTRFLPRFFFPHCTRFVCILVIPAVLTLHVKAGAERQSGISWIRRTTF